MRKAFRLGIAIGFIILLVQCMRQARVLADVPGPFFTQTVVIKQQDTYDTRGVQFFEIRNRQGSALVSVDRGLELAKVLKSLDGRTVRIVIESAELETLERSVRFGGGE